MTATFTPVHCTVCDRLLPTGKPEEVVENRVYKNGELDFIELAHRACAPEWADRPENRLASPVTTEKRLFNQSVTVTRRVNVDGHVMYEAEAIHGKTMTAKQGDLYLAVFTDLAQQSHRLDASAALITFQAFDTVWQNHDYRELPTTAPDRNYKGFDYLWVKDGLLQAVKDEGGVEESVVIETYEQFLHLCVANEHVLFSSSVDFAEQETVNPAVIALCERIRG